MFGGNQDQSQNLHPVARNATWVAGRPRRPSPHGVDVLDLKGWGRVAQLVEQCPFKAWVAGSSPAALTISFQVLGRSGKSRRCKLVDD